MSISDDPMKLARRVGYGLRPGEETGPDLREWAVSQLQHITPLDFYYSRTSKPESVTIRNRYGADAKPLTSWAEACERFGYYDEIENNQPGKEPGESDRQYEQRIYKLLWEPFSYVPIWRDCLVRTLTAVNGPSPVFERFWAFWVNHFTVSNVGKSTKIFYGLHTRNIRNRMTGRFADMLRDGVINPAMLDFLDNKLSTGPSSLLGKLNGEVPNENLAREIFELHSMSPAGGYTQADIEELTLALTGWGFYSGYPAPSVVRGSPYGLYFNWKRHETGNRTIMGKTYEEEFGGRTMVGHILEDLAAHPATARYLSWKLARAFVADEPPEAAVASIEEVWRATDGDLVAVHTAVVDAVLEHGDEYRKFTTPETWLLQVHRIAGIDPPSGRPWQGDDWTDAVFAELGQSYNMCPQPNGWSDLAADWISRELLDRRIRYGTQAGWRLRDKKRAVEVAERISGAGSELAKIAEAAPSATLALTYVVADPEFLWI